MKTLCRSLLLSALALSVSMAVPSLAIAQQQGIGSGYETRLSALEDQMRAMNGQLEQLGYAIRRLDQNVQRMQSDNDQRLTKLEVTVGTMGAAAETHPVLPNQAGIMEGTLGALRQRDGHITGAINAPQSPPLPDPGEEMSPEDQYDRAYAKLLQADYDGAEKDFKDFIEEYPSDKMNYSAKYFHAEALYGRGRFSEAATGFADTFKQNPQGPKAPDSLLKLSMSLAALNKAADACTALAELRQKYPAARASVKNLASEQRIKLKCAS